MACQNRLKIDRAVRWLTENLPKIDGAVGWRTKIDRRLIGWLGGVPNSTKNWPGGWVPHPNRPTIDDTLTQQLGGAPTLIENWPSGWVAQQFCSIFGQFRCATQPLSQFSADLVRHTTARSTLGHFRCCTTKIDVLPNCQVNVFG